MFQKGQNPSKTPSKSNYQLIFDNALAAYKKKTGKDIISDPLLRRLESCDSPDTVLAVLREQVPGFDQIGGSNEANDTPTKWLKPTVNVLYIFSSTIGSAASLAYPPAGVIFTGIATLLSAVQGVQASQGAFVDIFERIENVFRRLEAYVELPPTTEMTDVIVNIMVQVLFILALATKEFQQGKVKRFLKKLAGRSDIEDALQRLDKLTQEEHRMATAQDLRATCRVDDRVKGVDERMQGVGDRMKGFDDKIDVIIDGAEHMREELQQVVSHVSEQKRIKLRKNVARWLSPSDPFINFNITSGARHKDTALWFIQGSTFESWKEAQATTLLWIHGKPGAGKSVLTSAIIEDINRMCNAGSAHIAFFFFDFKDIGKQDARALLSSLIVQLSNQSNSSRVYDVLNRFHLTHNYGTQQPSVNTLTLCLEEIVIVAGKVPIYIILDGLDESPNTNGIQSSRDQVLALVERLVKFNLENLHLCITSRPEIDIRTSIEPLTTPENRISLHDQSGQKKDIVDFVRAIVYSDKNMRRWRDEDKELVIETLSTRADGMFRWIFCQLEVLRQCLPSSVRGVLAELPESLDETYERILQQIPRPNQVHAHRLLQCITVAGRPLRVEELAEVLAIDFSATGGNSKVDETLRWEDQEQAVLSTCSSLIAIVEDGGSRLAQFSHFSVKEFLTSDRLSASTVDGLHYHHIRLETAHTIMAQACLSVLLCLDKSMDKQTIRSFPLADYAGNYFGNHVEFEDVLSHVTDGVEDLLDPDKPHFYPWIWLQVDDWYHNSLNGSTISWITFDSRTKPQYPPRISPLYYVAALGHLSLTRHIVLKRPQDLHTKDDEGCTPLHKAVLLGREKVSQLLIEHSIDLSIRDIQDRTLLHMATYKGLSTVVRMLLENDGPFKVPVNAQTQEGQTALHLALRLHYPSIVSLLLKFGADVDVEDNDNMTPLLLALQLSLGGSGAAQLLLEHGASIHVRDKYGRTPLHLASWWSNSSSVAALLLTLGADVDAQAHDNITPLLLASRSRNVATMKVLLEHGANVHVRTETGQMPLHFASKHGLSSIVALLLKLGAHVNAQDNDDMTPLHFASQSQFSQSRAAVVQLLLEHGANIHARNKNGQTPLHLASKEGLSSTVSLLLNSGADMDAEDNNRTTPRHFSLSPPSQDISISIDPPSGDEDGAGA